MKLGINSYTYMWAIGFESPDPAQPGRACPARPLTALGLLEKARGLGVSLVQTGPNLPFETLPAAAQDLFIARAAEWGITLELGARGLDGSHLGDLLGLARRMGARLIRTIPELDGQYLTEPRQMLPPLRAVLPALEEAGICLAVENGRMPAAGLAAALDELGSPRVGVVLDMVNSLAVPEGWKEVTRQLARHTMCLHYKDFTIRRAWHMMGFLCEGAPAGQGRLDTPWLFEQLQASPYDFNVILELWPPEQADLDQTIALEQAWAEQSVAYLRRLIQD